MRLSDSSIIGDVSDPVGVTRGILRAAASDMPSYIYVDKRYSVDISLLPLVNVLGRMTRALVFEARHTLWFSLGGSIALVPDMVVIVRGSIRAGRSTIFRLPEVVNSSVSPGIARVIIESDRIDTIYPEWFGADVAPAIGYVAAGENSRLRANHGALQACVHAACRDRVRTSDGRRLPPLTVSLRGIYDFDDTIEVLPPSGAASGALMLRSDGTAVRRGTGSASLVRVPRTRPRPGGVPGDLREGPESAALQVDPRVSLIMDGVDVKVELRSAHPDPDTDVAMALSLPEDHRTPRWRHAYLDRCGLTGGREACLSIVDNDARGASVSAGGRMPEETRATHYTLRDVTLDGKIGEAASSRVIVNLAMTQDALLDMRGGVMFQSKLEEPPREVQLRAGMLLRGGSLLVRGVSMHLTEGPRPSLPNSGTASAQPDGQDVFVDSGSRNATGAHATLMHIDSQSWWFLGSRPLADRQTPSMVCVLNVGAGNINWAEGSVGALESGRLQLANLVDPPSIAWAGGHTGLLIEGSFFRRYVTTLPSMRPVVSLGGTFTTVDAMPIPESWWLSPEAIPEAGVHRRSTRSLTSVLPSFMGVLRGEPSA